MFKRVISLILVLLLGVSIAACSAKPQDTSASEESVAAQQEQTTLQGGEESAAEKQGKSKTKDSKTTAKKDNTKKKASDNSAGDKKSAASDKKSSADSKSGSKKKSTTSAPTTQSNTLRISFSIDCSAALGEVGGLPSSGYFCKDVSMHAEKGDTVYDALMKCCDKQGISVVAGKTMYGMYVSAIGDLAEFDVGQQSGWTYTVNGQYPPRSCDKQELKDGDTILFLYKAG